MFYNELEILKIRLKELYDVVDYFIIVEATGTHNNNKQKPLYYAENKHLFETYQDKIIHIVTDYMENYDFAKFIPTHLNEHWFRENYQRECIKIGLNKLNLEPTDIIILSDADEIPKKSIIHNIKTGILKLKSNDIYSLQLSLYYYDIEHTTNRKWYHSKIFHYSTMTYFNLLTDIRLSNNALVIKNAGFHLSYFGDVNFIKTKVESFAESVEYTDEGKSFEHLQKCYNNGILHFNNEKLIYIPLENNNNIPEYYKDLDPPLNTYSHSTSLVSTSLDSPS